MKTLFLTSSGIPEDLRDIFISLLPKPPGEISVAYIITATIGAGGYKLHHDLRKQELQRYGIGNIENIDVRDKDEQELEEIFSHKDMIYVTGGNTFYLLKSMKESGCDKVITKLVDQGKLYVGISAGSYVVCPTIEQAHWRHQDRNDFGVTDLTALNLVPFLVTAHFSEEARRSVEEGASTTTYPVVALHDGQAVLVQNDTVRVVGNGERTFLNGFKE